MISRHPGVYMQGIAELTDVEFLLTVERLEGSSGFMDRASLELSESIKNDPNRLQMAHSLIILSDACETVNGQLFYIPSSEAEEPQFYKKHDGELYMANMSDVKAFARTVINYANNIMDNPLSLCTRGVIVDGLDYFNNPDDIPSISGRMPPRYNTESDRSAIQNWLR